MEEKTEMGRWMEEIPPEKHLEILSTAYKYRIDENDPAWILVRLAVGSISDIEKVTNDATKALRESSVKVTEATTAEVNRSSEKAAMKISTLRDESVILINEAKEKAKGDIAEALGNTLTKEIGKAVDTLSMETTAKKWLSIGVSVAGIVVTAGIIGAYVYGAQNGPIFGAMSKDYQSLVACSNHGWQKQKITIEGENYLICAAGPDPNTGKLYYWRIKDLGGVPPSGNSP